MYISVIDGERKKNEWMDIRIVGEQKMERGWVIKQMAGTWISVGLLD